MKALAALLVGLLAGPAAALTVAATCADEDDTVEGAFKSANERTALMVMAHGEFRPGPMTYEEIYGYDDEVALRHFAGRFLGRSATAAGFSNAFAVPVMITQYCVQSFCFPRFDGTLYVAFIEKSAEGYVFDFAVDDCAPPGFENPDPLTLDRAVACMSGGCE